MNTTTQTINAPHLKYFVYDFICDILRIIKVIVFFFFVPETPITLVVKAYLSIIIILDKKKIIIIYSVEINGILCLYLPIICRQSLLKLKPANIF